MRTIEQIISAHASEILDAWAEEVKQAAARGLSRPELMNIMPKSLRSLARGMATCAASRPS
jgi:hypothetical protein